MPLVIAGLAVAGGVTAYMASAEQTGNANAQAYANYLNQEHQARLKVQQQNDQQIQNVRRQTLQNLYIGRAATATKIRNKRSLNRAARQQFAAMNESNKTAYELMNASIGAKNISGSSGTALAMKRQAFRNWARTTEAMKYNTRQQFQAVDDQYQGTLAKMDKNEYLLNSYIGGQAPQPINGGWSALAAGVGGATSGAMTGLKLTE
jgi:thiol:disulfide interchange protein